MILLGSPIASAKIHAPIEAGDEVLVKRALTGDDAAYVELYRRHSQRAAKMILSITKNAEDTEDALQETFIKVFLHLGSFDGRAQFSTWLTRIAINSALMVLRKRLRKSEISLDGHSEDDAGPAIQLQDFRPDPEVAYLRQEEIVQVRKAVQRLPPLLRQVAEIRCSDDLPLKEIAGTTGISVAAAKSRLLRAGVKLHLKLSPYRTARQGQFRKSQRYNERPSVSLC